MSLSAFIGRDEDALRLGQLLADRRLVTIVGPGGIGKTRLASEWVARTDVEFPGGLHRSELASISPREDVGTAVAGSLGFASVEALLVALGDAHALVVLDNCEHVLHATSRFCRLLLARCPGLHVLATSREPLAVDGEQVLILGPLGLPSAGDDVDRMAATPAVRLFADRARATGARFDATSEQLRATAELCRRLDGVPLAIELAAARSRSLTPAELLAHLDRRFELLRRAESVGGARHGSLRAAIDTSYELLRPEERAFFRAVGVFAGPFDLAGAHAVAAPPGGDRLSALDMLSRLVDRSLIVSEQHGDATRYRLLDSLRHYAADAAREAGEFDALGDRFVAAMVDSADRIVTEGMAGWSARVFAAMLVQFRNFAAAIETCLEHDATAERAFRLLLPMWGAIHQGRAAEVAALCDRVLAQWREGTEPWRAEVGAVAANAYLVEGRLEDATQLATATLERAPASVLTRVLAWRVLGLAARHHGDRETAADRFGRARDAAADAGLSPFARELTTFVASVTPASARDGALATLQETIARAIADGDSINEIWARLVTAHLLIEADRRAEARAALSVADQVQSRIDYVFGRSAAARLGAVLATLDAGWPSMRGTWHDVIRRIAASGDLGELASTLRTAAALAMRSGDRSTADALIAAVPAGAPTSGLDALFGGEVPAAAGSSETSTMAAPAGDALRRLRATLEMPNATPDDVRDPQPAPPAPAIAQATMASAGGGAWEIAFGGRSVQIRHLKGLDDLVVLLSRPEQEVHCIELVGGTDAGGEALPGLDDRARREYRARIRELQEAIDEARAQNDPLPAERAEAELDVLVQQISASFGLGGRARARGSAAERARSTVAWRIRAAIKRIAQLHPELGRHLENAIRTGAWCVYRPESPVAWRITLSS